MKLHEYQKAARDFVVGQLEHRPGCGLWIDCGLGKTTTVLHAIELLKWLYGYKKTLILAPRRVVESVWPKEIEKWNLPLTCVRVQGSPSQRLKALQVDADIYLATKDSTPWLARLRDWKFDLLVVDESTAYKNWSAQRTKALRHILLRIPKRITLTGTPTPNSLADIFSQQFILDSGKTLGATVGSFRDRYMTRGGYENREWIFNEAKEKELKELIAPWYLHQSALDHLDMPELLVNAIEVTLPDEAKEIYKEMQTQMFAELDSETSLTALSAGAKYNLCRQIASGAAYSEPGLAVCLHDAKIEALCDLVQELNGKPLLVAYCFTHEMLRIKEKFPHARVINGQTSNQEFAEILRGWKSGKVRMILAQCQAMSHGVDGLQHNCNDVCWFSLTDQPEIHDQLNARIWRQGVTNHVRIHYLLAKGTVDVAIKRVLAGKSATQSDVLKAIKEMNRGN